MMSLVVRYLDDRHLSQCSGKTVKHTITPSIHRPHELVFSIGRDEADAAFRVKLAEADALVERAVIDRDGLFAAAAGDTEERTLE